MPEEPCPEDDSPSSSSSLARLASEDWSVAFASSRETSALWGSSCRQQLSLAYVLALVDVDVGDRPAGLEAEVQLVRGLDVAAAGDGRLHDAVFGRRRSRARPARLRRGPDGCVGEHDQGDAGEDEQAVEDGVFPEPARQGAPAVGTRLGLRGSPSRPPAIALDLEGPGFRRVVAQLHGRRGVRSHGTAGIMRRDSYRNVRVSSENPWRLSGSSRPDMAALAAPRAVAGSSSRRLRGRL